MTGPDRWRDPAVAREILSQFRVWAVVGCSSDPLRPSFGVSAYLLDHGYEVLPVNPGETEVHGQLAYPDLATAAAARSPDDPPIEVVDLFRRADQVAAHVDEAIAIGARAIWMQLGVRDEAAAERARAAGLRVVMDRCPAIDHPALIGSP